MYNGMKISEEHDIEIPLWLLCVVLFIELIPLINIIAFIGFVVWYVIIYNSTPQQWLIKHTFELQLKSAYGFKWVYKEPPNDYYQFLMDIGYTEDPQYVEKLKNIVKRYG